MIFFIPKKFEREKPSHKSRYLSKGSKAVCGATSIGNNVEVRLVFLLIDTNNKHGSIFARGRYDDLLCTSLRSKKEISSQEMI